MAPVRSQSFAAIFFKGNVKVNHFWANYVDYAGTAVILVYYWSKMERQGLTVPPRKKLGAAEVAALIRREIFKGNLALQDRLDPERRLAESYGVARGTVREALTRLEEENFVEIRPGSGTYVTYQKNLTSEPAIEGANPLELMDARFALEPHICRLVVLHGRRSDFELMDILCERMENALSDATAFAEADSDFHRALVQSTRNTLLIWIIDQITSVRGQDEWMRMRHLTLDEGIIAQYNAQHRQILNALRRREPERAADMMKEHLETARLSLTRAART